MSSTFGSDTFCNEVFLTLGGQDSLSDRDGVIHLANDLNDCIGGKIEIFIIFYFFVKVFVLDSVFFMTVAVFLINYV